MKSFLLIPILFCLSVFSIAQSNEKTIFTLVEQMPEYPGGQEALIKFISQNLKYPESAKEAGISGTVYVSFIVSEKGNIESVKAISSVHELLDKEAIRVVKEMPSWKPGIQKGKPVKVQFTLPLKFTLLKESK